ncbi:hypothetical protein [Priestia megaterium]|uniref:hypothetical protein n=1 Tax=Priestia megaterium TaxID=1404 RepID=UPI003CC64EE8
MKDTKKIIEELIDVQIGYYNDRKEITKYLKDQPVILAMLESYTDRIKHITDIIIEDILEIPDNPRNNKYDSENWSRKAVAYLIEHVIEHGGEYKNSAIDIILDWEAMDDHLDKLNSTNWFYSKELLEEHSKGFPTYQKKLEKEEKEKKKRTKKETA